MARERFLIGVDEAGRGPLAGPVAVAAVCFDRWLVRQPRRLLAGIKDSKRLSLDQRLIWWRRAREWRRQNWLDWRVALVGQELIDRRGIVRAVRLGIKRCLARLARPPARCQVLLDGCLAAPSVYLNQTTIIGGDECEPVIALASILAKLRRDRRMVKLARLYPVYGFELHKGYGTAAHYRALARHGPSPLHRRSFLL